MKNGTNAKTGMAVIAAVQMEPAFGEKTHNLGRMSDFIDQAAGKGAALIVFPELCSTGYAFKDRSELAGMAEEIPSGETVRVLTKKAKETGAYIVAGIAEKDGENLYNSAVLVGPGGLVGSYRKCHLWNKEKLLFQPGNLGFPVFDLPFARVGIQICYDFFFVEGTRILALMGADIVAVPTNWPVVNPESTWDDRGYCMGDYRAVAYSNINQVYIACANRVGKERGLLFSGGSIITGSEGWPLAGPASKDSEDILYAEVDIDKARYARIHCEDEGLKERRCDLYHELLGYNGA